MHIYILLRKKYVNVYIYSFLSSSSLQKKKTAPRQHPMSKKEKIDTFYVIYKNILYIYFNTYFDVKNALRLLWNICKIWTHINKI